MTPTLAVESLPLATDADGVVRVGGTRVTLDSIYSSFQQGASAEQIALDYPSLELCDVYSVIGYILRHSYEVQQYLATQQGAANEWRAKLEVVLPTSAIRDRLRSFREFEVK